MTFHILEMLIKHCDIQYALQHDYRPERQKNHCYTYNWAQKNSLHCYLSMYCRWRKFASFHNFHEENSTKRNTISKRCAYLYSSKGWMNEEWMKLMIDWLNVSGLNIQVVYKRNLPCWYLTSFDVIECLSRMK